jgi:hypothetical protein
MSSADMIEVLASLSSSAIGDSDHVEVHDYHVHAVAILAASLPRRMSGYRTLGFTKA